MGGSGEGGGGRVKLYSAFSKHWTTMFQTSGYKTSLWKIVGKAFILLIKVKFQRNQDLKASTDNMKAFPTIFQRLLRKLSREILPKNIMRESQGLSMSRFVDPSHSDLGQDSTFGPKRCMFEGITFDQRWRFNPNWLYRWAIQVQSFQSTSWQPERSSCSYEARAGVKSPKILY